MDPGKWDIMIWYRVTRYPRVFDTSLRKYFHGLTIGQRDPRVLGCHSLGHISRQKMERLMKDKILPNLDFSYFDTCVDCIKSKLTTKIRNVKVDIYTELLWVIDIDICGSFTPPDMDGPKYSIMFIDDYSHYGFFELIREKSNI